MDSLKQHFAAEGGGCASMLTAGASATVPLWKRMLDLTCILLALPTLIPLMLLVAVIVKIGSRGSVIFKQERVGLYGKRFTIYKFRTMVIGASTAVHEEYLRRLIDSNRPMDKLDARGDSRVVPFGWWLRATGLDELAQVINVLRGDMSLVGPRPCLPSEHEKYQPWQNERFNTLPGLTGLWQVSGKNRTTFEEMIRLDINYARNKSLWLDLKIILYTLPALGMQIQDMRGGGQRRLSTISRKPQRQT